MNTLKTLVIAILTASSVSSESWDRGWVHSDVTSAAGFNVLTGENYTSFDDCNHGKSEMYITVGQAKEFCLNRSDYSVYSGRFSHLITGLSNHGKHVKNLLDMCQKDINCKLSDRDMRQMLNSVMYEDIRISNTRHYVIDILEIIESGHDQTGQFQDLYERYKLYDCENDLPYRSKLESAGIKIMCGAGRQACNRHSVTKNEIILADTFKSDTHLLRTYLHELSHSAAVPSGDNYARSRAIEEAIAETTAVILQIEQGKKPVISQYIFGWLTGGCKKDFNPIKAAEILTPKIETRLNWILS